MTSKEFLEQGIKIAQDIDAHNSEQDALHKIALATGAIRYDTDKVIHSITEARFERPIICAVDLENTVKNEIRRLIHEHNRIREAVNQIKDANIRNVIRMRYLGWEKVDVIACKLKISKKTVLRRLDIGYQEIARITGYPAPVRSRLPAEERHADSKRLLREYYKEEQDE